MKVKYSITLAIKSIALVMAVGPMALTADSEVVPPAPTVTPKVKIVEPDAKTAAVALIKRVIPEHAQFFEVDVTLAKANDRDTFSVSDAPDGKILLRGNNGVSIASALHWYLKNRCNCHISWNDAYQLKLPAKLPKVGEEYKVSTLHKHRVYFNYCTLNYTASWWDWERWERETDFMAMQGINMPLGVIGLEGTWYYTLLQHGFSDEEARSFIVSPAHFAWQWMTNIQNDYEPIPKEWIDKRVELGRKLAIRQRSLGMKPIQQGFTGFVPRELAAKYPDAAIAKVKEWGGFKKGSAQLDPLDPLFKKLGKTFLETQTQLYGSSHVYAADPFHEGAAPRPGQEYLTKVGHAIYDLLKEVDPKSTIAMQSWSIKKAICQALPKDRVIILDLRGQRNDFWGYSYVKGVLGSFGGRTNMHGPLSGAAENRFATTAKENPLCSGMGLFPESIEHNAPYFNMVFDMIWRHEPVVPLEWISDYAKRRYGKETANSQAAWKILLEEGPYGKGTGGNEYSSIIAARPALIAKKSGPNRPFKIPYKPLALVKALDLLLKDYDELKDNKGYQFDVADITRQVLSNLGQEIHRDVEYAFYKKDAATLKSASARFLTILADVDAQMKPIGTFHFGKWLSDARSYSEDPATQAYYEKYAAMLVTIWGPIDEPKIFDYAWREWSGLIDLYYQPRWKMFLDHLQAKLAADEDYTDPDSQVHGRETLRANDFYSKLADWELAWVKKAHTIPEVSSENAATIGRDLYAKYKPIIESTYTEERLKERATMKATKKYVAGLRAGSWSSKSVRKDWNTLKFKLTKRVLTEGGTYEFIFRHKAGVNQLDVESVQFMLGDKVLHADARNASINSATKEEVIYTLEVKDFVANSDYQLWVKCKYNGDKDTAGAIYIRKKK